MSEAAQQIFTIMWVLFVPIGPNNPQKRIIAYMQQNECIVAASMINGKCEKINMSTMQTISE